MRLAHADVEERRIARRPRSFYGPVLLAAALYAGILAYEAISTIALSFVLILLISLALNPFIVKLRQVFGNRSAGVAVVVVAFLILVALAALAFSGPLKASGVRVIDQLSAYWERIQEPLAKLDKVGPAVQADPTDAIAHAAPASPKTDPAKSAVTDSSVPSDEKPGVFRAAARESLNALVSSFKKFALNTVSLFVIAVTVFFGTIFTLLKPHPIFQALFAWIPERYHSQTLDICQRIARFVPRWAIATLLAMLVVAALVFLSMWPVLGFGNALTLGLISGMLEAVPYLGALVSSIPGLLVALSKGGWTPLWVLLIYVAVYSLEAYLIAPLIMADQLHLHPLGVLFSVFICGAAFGVLGVLIAVPALMVVRILHDEFYRPRFLPHVSDRELNQIAHVAFQPKKGKE